MKRKIKTMQKNVIDSYLDELKGINATCAEDIWEMIEQAKSLKNMCYQNAKENTMLIKYFVQLGEFILKCYESLPEEKKNDSEKTSIEQALSILWNTSVN